MLSISNLFLYTVQYIYVKGYQSFLESLYCGCPKSIGCCCCDGSFSECCGVLFLCYFFLWVLLLGVMLLLLCCYVAMDDVVVGDASVSTVALGAVDVRSAAVFCCRVHR